jgi:hypothetical protein
MLLRSLRDPSRFYVDWWLMNHCSLRCSYCADVIRNGSAALPDIAKCQDFLTRLKDHVRDQGFRSVDFSITGGEPTEWCFLPDLLASIHQLGWQVTLRSNATADRAVWTRVLDTVSAVKLEFHPEYANTAHFAAVIAQTLKAGVSCSVTMMMLPERWQELESWQARMQALYPDLAFNRRMLFADPVVNTEPLEYTEPQQQSLINQTGDLEFYQDGEPLRTDFAALLVNDLNRFSGQQCAVGLEQIVIDAWGRVYNGHCRQGGRLGTIGGEILWPQKMQTCGKPRCSNGFDITATKS